MWLLRLRAGGSKDRNAVIMGAIGASARETIEATEAPKTVDQSAGRSDGRHVLAEPVVAPLTPLQVLRFAEQDLLALGAVLDQDRQIKAPIEMPAWMLGHRARSFYVGFQHAAKGPSGAAATSMIRPLLARRRRRSFRADRTTSTRTWSARTSGSTQRTARPSRAPPSGPR